MEYQKNKMKMAKMGHQNEEEVEELRKYVNKLKKRIENLEAIAAGDPEEFKKGSGLGMKEIEIDEPEPKEQNEADVSKISNQLKSGQ